MFLFSFCAGAVPVSLLQFCVLVYSFWLRMRSDKCGNQMTMLFNLSRCCKLYSFKKTLKCCFRNWSLRAEDFFFVFSLWKKKKRNKHTRMCLQFTLIWTAPVFTVRFFLFEICLVLRVLRFSYIFFFCFLRCYPLLWSVIWVAYTDLHVLISIWLSKNLGLRQMQSSIMKSKLSEIKHFALAATHENIATALQKYISAGDSGCKWHLWPADGAADQLGPQESRHWRQTPQGSHSFDRGC